MLINQSFPLAKVIKNKNLFLLLYVCFGDVCYGRQFIKVVERGYKDMKKGLISTIIATAAVVVMSTTSFAALRSTKITGSIASADAKMAVSLPTSIFSVSPYSFKSASQISSRTNYIKNTLSATNPQAICYDVRIVGYTSNVKSASYDNPIEFSGVPLTKDDYDSEDTSKTVYIALQAAEPVDAKGTESNDFQNLRTDVTVTVENDEHTFSNAQSDFITIKPGQFVPYRVTGTVNPYAKWSSGEYIKITPIFKVKANVAADVK